MATIPQFTYPPETYRQHAENRSRLWTLWMPLLSVFVVLGVALISREASFKWMFSERTGVVEFIHALFPVLTAIIALGLLRYDSIRSDPFLVGWCIVMAIGGIYLGGEEASWGQHYIGWTTPEFWANVNDQQETNLHNTSFLLDQYPRTILKVGIFFSALILPWFLLNKPHLVMRRFDFVYPGLTLVPMALLILFTQFYNQAQDWVDWKIVRLVRGGEFQELYIVWFLLLYALMLRRRAKQADAVLNGEQP
ncbi:MAG: hypothetical protein AAGF28_02250 [Pseudomonadota bacterium]